MESDRVPLNSSAWLCRLYPSHTDLISRDRMLPFVCELFRLPVQPRMSSEVTFHSQLPKQLPPVRRRITNHIRSGKQRQQPSIEKSENFLGAFLMPEYLQPTTHFDQFPGLFPVYCTVFNILGHYLYIDERVP